MASNYPEILQVPVTKKMKDDIDKLKNRTGNGMPFMVRPMLEKGINELMSETEGLSDE